MLVCFLGFVGCCFRVAFFVIMFFLFVGVVVISWRVFSFVIIIHACVC